MRRILAAVVLSATLALTFGGLVAQAQGKPEFKLGFKVLADQIPNVVGQPLENERWGSNGDSMQQTTRGLMVWRKADNWTAFTDGATTWLNGPLGVQSRPNDRRFPWEADGEPANPVPQSRLTMDKLKNAEYVLDDGTRVRLTNGSVTLPFGGGVWLDEGYVRYGDLNRDGNVDAAVLLAYSGGGSGVFVELVAVLDQSGMPRQADGAPLGDRIKLERFQITSDGEIQIRMITQGPNDPMCCPTLQVDQYYRLVNSKLQMSVQ